MKYNKKRWKMDISIVLGTGTIMINKSFLKPWTYQPENNPKKSGCFFVLLC